MPYLGTVEDIIPGSIWVYCNRINSSCPSLDIMTSSIYIVDSVNGGVVDHHNQRGIVTGSSYSDTLEVFLRDMIPRPSNQRVAMIRLETILSMIKGSEGISKLEVYSMVDERGL